MRSAWWETRTFAAVAIVASMIPLLWPSLPPLADLPGHVGRYHIAAQLAHSPDLARHWAFEGGLVGNLGVDLLVQLLARLRPVELATKIVVLFIPPLWVSGLILLSRLAGSLSPTAAFAFPLAYSFPFQFGFVNFMLSAGLAFHALVLWVWLGRRGSLRLRAVLFLPISCALWVAHSFGWGMFGLLAFATDLVRLRRKGKRWLPTLLMAGVHCLVLATPLIFMTLAAANGPPSELSWNWTAKASWFPSILRERWKWYDVACAFVLVGLVWAGVRDRRLRFDPVIGAGAMICMVAFLALPRLALGGSYVDMRMLAPALGLALVAIRVVPGNDRLARALALAAAGFFALRTVTSTVAMLLFAQTQQTALEAVQHIPRGAAVLVLVNEPCSSRWHSDRLGHIAGIAVARRDIFENGQWTLDGQQLLRARHPAAAPYAADPSQLVYPASCEYRTTNFDAAIRDFDRATFTYVWTIGFPARIALAADVTHVWSNQSSSLYRVH